MMFARPAHAFWIPLAILWSAASSGFGQTPSALGSDTSTDSNVVTHEEADSSESEALIPLERLGRHLPDPEEFRAGAADQIERARQRNDLADIGYVMRVLERLDTIRRPLQIHVTLDEVLRRVLANSYAIKTQSYNPAIEATRVVEAQSAFDALFFTNIAKTNTDRPTGTQLFSGDLDQFTSSYGIRKALATGMQVTGSWNLNRTKTALSFQLVNPEYTSDFSLEMRQPLLRGAGIDFNRSQIHVARKNRAISESAFRREVRDTLRQVDELYWRLVQARRDVTITARLLSSFEAIYSYLDARKDFDVIPVQLNATKANLEQSRADFIRRRAVMLDAEERLVAAMNDPDIPMGAGIEIIPDELPWLGRIVVDPLAEVQTALDNRQEIAEQRIAVDVAKIIVGQAKNQALPRFDVTFRYTAQGLSGTADRAFDQMSGSNFITYFVGVDFEIPFGNRGPLAARRRAELQRAQAEALLRARIEEAILEVNVAVRQLETSYDQIAPTFESAKARQREVDSSVARAERKDIATLNGELGARQSLATERRSLLNAMVEYNVAMIELERAKGTLLRYNNVIVETETDQRD